jgi:hypothetical protein
VRVFGAFTSDLTALATWRVGCGIETGAMESTGVYGVALYEILVERGLEVYLVNARHAKNLPGRKSDRADCQWLYQLHSYGLLRASFLPTEQLAPLRVLVRQREMLIQASATHIQHRQKALLQMNLRLTNVVSDIRGQTGLRIMRAILTGEEDPATLARWRDPKCAKSAAEIAAALTGHLCHLAGSVARCRAVAPTAQAPTTPQESSPLRLGQHALEQGRGGPDGD